MKRILFLAVVVLLACAAPARATTLWPELKAYDFARAYYIEDGGIVVVPQDNFFCSGAVKTPEGLRIMPGQTFTQLDVNRHIMEVYHFVRVDPDGHRAYFHERRYHYTVVLNGAGKGRVIRQEYIDSDDFYLTRFRALEWFDFAFPNLEIHPGEQLWRTRQ